MMTSGLSFTWIEDVQVARELAGEWSALAKRVKADAYMTPQWFFTRWDNFGTGKSCACLVARRDEALVAVVPFTIEKFFGVRVARLADGDPHAVVLAVCSEADALPEVLDAAISGILETTRADVLTLSPVSKLSDLQKLRELDLPALEIDYGSLGGHIVFDLPDSFDAYLSTLSRNRRSHFRRRLKSLNATFGVNPVRGVSSPETIDDFIAFHNTQWQAVQKGGHFSDWAGSARFYAELSAADETPVRLYHLTDGTNHLASQMSLVSGQTCHWRLPARSLDPEAERLSAGMVCLMCMFGSLIEEGVTCLEAGVGEYGYKLSIGGREVAVDRIVISRKGAWDRFILSLLLAMSAAVDFLYYRVWFKKLAPRLRRITGAQAPPLWTFWRRTRI